LRALLKHPILPGESISSFHKFEEVDFKSSHINEFSLKYLAKFISSHNIEKLSINGGMIPIRNIKTDNLTLLNMSEQGLYSEDLFILS